MSKRRRLAYVTGATGFVGSHLAERLVKEGFRVRALVLEDEDASFLEALGVACVRGDLRDSAAELRTGLEGVTHVFHCAAWVADLAVREQMAEVNVSGLRNLLEATRGIDLVRFVFLGSIVVYGDRDQVDIDESFPFSKTGDSYNYTKIESERVLGAFVRETGLPAVILRPSYIYGPRDTRLFPSLIDAVRAGEWVYLSGGRLPIALSYVGHVVDACVLAAARDEAVGEGFIITDGESITRRELTELVCDALRLRRPRASVPRGVGKALCPFGDCMRALFRRQKPYFINRFLYHFAGAHLTFDISKARKLLGYAPKRPMRELLLDTVQWFRENRPELLPDNGKDAT